MEQIVDYSAKSTRPVSLSLNESTLVEASRYTADLSATVNALLADYVARESGSLAEKKALYKKVAEAWNKLDDQYGSFGEQYSPL